MPLCRAAEPAAEGQKLRDFERQGRMSIMDLQSAHDHHDNGGGIDPMGRAHDERMNHELGKGVVSFRPSRRPSRIRRLHGHDEELLKK
jgi:hypothetical protein